MRASLPASLVAHGALIALAVVGLHAGQPLEPEPIESISVDLVPVEAFSNIRVGTEKSKVIETQTPSAVQTDKPAELAQRTGNTTEDQPNPLDSNTPTPAPTVQTAPKPEPTPAPVVRDVTPNAPPPAPAPPTPAPAPEPVLATEPKPAAEPQPVAPQVASAADSLAKRRAEFVKQRQAEKAAAEAARQQQQAKPADQISDIINTEKSRGATTGQGGQQTAGKPTGQAARLTQSERDALAQQMRACWNPPLAAKDTPGLTVQLLVNLNPDGTVNGTPQITSTIKTQLEDTTARAAQRAVLRCGPYRLAPDKYSEWQQVDVTFDPRDLP